MGKIVAAIVVVIMSLCPALAEGISYPPPSAVGVSAVGQIPGTATNDSANAGNVGEFITASRASGSALGLTSGAAASIASVSLTAGNWCITGYAGFSATGTTIIADTVGGASATTNVVGAEGTYSRTVYPASAFAGAATVPIQVIPMACVNLSTTTTYFLVESADFTISTLGGFGGIFAQRVR